MSSEGANDTAFWEEFIAMFRGYPCLWDANCSDFNDQAKRDIAYEALTEKVRKIDVNANTDTVKDKIMFFRTMFRNEFDAAKQNQHIDPKDLATWCHYESLSFLIPFVDDAAGVKSDGGSTSRGTGETPNRPRRLNIRKKIKRVATDVARHLRREHIKELRRQAEIEKQRRLGKRTIVINRRQVPPPPE